MLPASNEKVLTLAAAASRLGWEFTFTTELAVLGPIDGGVLYGDVVVTGSGDPTIDDWDGQATALFSTWAGELRARGIRVVTGGVVGDDNRLPDASLGAGWPWDDLDRSFAAATGALQFNQNTARLVVKAAESAGARAEVGIEPAGSGLTIESRVFTTGREVPPQIVTRRGASNPSLDVRGSIPVGTGTIVRNVSVANPTLYFATALRNTLIANGIEIRGGPVDIDDLFDPSVVDRRTRVLTHRSPALSAVAVTMMKVSQNLFAETLLQAVGGPPTVSALLAEWNAGAGITVADGSGLSRYNLCTAETLVAVLTHVYRDERLRDAFQASLPIAGRDGTLATRMIGTAAEGNVRAKTGAFSNARGLAGYVETADREPLVFSILVNNFGTTPDVIEAAIDAVAVKLAEFSRR